MLSLDTITHYFEQKNIPQDIYKYQKLEHFTDITYETFFRNYLTLNKPCVLAINSSSNWKSTLEWVLKDNPNLQRLEQLFGAAVVPVADCNEREYNSQKKHEIVFKDYLNYWFNIGKDENSELLYLKDWHFKRQFPEYVAYETPEYFQSDWLNEFCKDQDDDYQFVYMGPKGTWTPLHADVFGSYSWSINICGCKKWLLFPPGVENKLKDGRKQLPYKVEESYLLEHDIFHIKVVQNAQEIIFVPSGWYHQVHNLEDTISINHNWFNGCNIEHIWKCLHQALEDVKNEVADCKDCDDWEDQLEIILKVHHGMNYSDFLLLLQSITKSRMERIQLDDKAKANWHFIFDLLCIKHLCQKMKLSVSENILQTIQDLLLSITEFLSNIDEVKNILNYEC